MDYAGKRIESYYTENLGKVEDDRTKEANKVSVRIGAILS